MENIYLIGLMGSGKTSIGKVLARKIHRRFVDTDLEVERTLGQTIPEIFASQGEEAFRQAETAALRDLAKRRNRVVSTGGGAVLSKENIELMRSSGKVVWLKRRPELILQGKRIRQRPLLAKDPHKIYDIAAEREAIYAGACHFTVDNNGSREETVAKILASLWK